MATARMSLGRTIAAHAVLITYTVIALFPVFVIVVNSFKSRKAIFADPLALPTAEQFRSDRLSDGDEAGRFLCLLPAIR